MMYETRRVIYNTTKSNIKGSLITGSYGFYDIAILLTLCLFFISPRQSFASGNCCSISMTTSVIYPSSNTSTGSISVTPTSGRAPYKYSWSNHDTTASITHLAQGIYSVTVTDALHCTAANTFDLTPYLDQLPVTTTSSADTCNAGLGSASVNVGSNCTFADRYHWSNGATTATVTGLTAGTYTVTVTDGRDCSATASIIVRNIGTPILENGTVYQPVCPSSTGTIHINPSGGTAAVYRVLWSNGSTADTLQNLAPGTYSVTVFGKNGCKSTTSYMINPPPSAIAISSTVTSPICNGGRGSITINPTGGNGSPYSISWSNSAQGTTVTNLLPGSYTVTVTDSKGCNASKTFTINQGELINPLATIVSPICTSAGGMIQMTPANGLAPYRYSWSSGDTSTIKRNLSAGTYHVTVTDANSCTVSQNFTLTPSMVPITLSTTAIPDTCSSGKGKAIVTVTSTASQAPFTYAWTNGQRASIVTSLTPASYSVSVTDANGCQGSTTTVVTNFISTLSISGNTTNPICTNSNGTISLTSVTGGKAPYSYRWNTGATSANISSLVAGTYTVTVTDANSCTSSQTFTLTTTSIPLALSTGSVSDTCYSGKGKTSVSVTSTDSQAPFTYAWTNGQNTATASGLTPSSYVVIVTDANGCQGSASAVVGNYISNLSISGLTADPICTNSNGTITLTTVSGGKAPYSYKWNTGTTTAYINGLSAGTYSVTVTDANSCTSTQSFVLTTVNTTISGSAIAIGDTCAANIGQAYVTVYGGTAPMTYNWSNGGSADTITGLGANSYAVTVTDINGCSATTATTILNIGTPITVSGNISLPVCHVDSAALAISISGGTSKTYSMLWSTGATTNNISGLGDGIYTVTVSGTNGCKTTQSFTVTLPDSITLLYTTTPVKCDSSMGGTIIETQFTGAAYPWTMSWTGPGGFISNSIDLDHLGAGTYSYHMVDSKGCIAKGSYVVNKTGQLTTSYVVANTSCPGANNGSIQRQDLTQYSSPVFHWTGPNGYTSDSTSIKNLAPGVYTLLITQAYGCTVGLTDTVYNGPPSSLIYTSTPVRCDSSKGGTLIKTGAVNSYYPWTMSWTGPNGYISAQTNLIGVAAGTYTLNFIDSRGCTGTQNFSVDSSGALSASYTASPVTCIGSGNGSINYVSVTPYSAQARYSWTGPNGYTDTAQSALDLAPGTYSVTIAENFGCKVSDTFTLAQQFDVGVSSIKNINCPAANIHMIIHPIAGDLSQLSGNHCVSGISGQVIMTITGAVQYEGVEPWALVPDSINGNTFIWNIADFGTVNTDSSFFVKIHVDTNVVLGSQICVNMQVTPTAGDYNPSNNTSSYCMTVIVAYDPNSKQVLPQGNISPAQKDLTYTIPFQNIGTGPAHHVFILDTLDPGIDPYSFEVLASSFPVQVSNTDGALRFDFDNIDLTPVSIDSLGSIGWVQYRATLRDGLDIGTKIRNTADIYFDYNQPIATNTTVNTIISSNTGADVVSTDVSEVRLYPDPAHDYVSIKTSQDLTGGYIQIYDVTGRKYKDVIVSGRNPVIQVRDLPAGVYLINIISPSGVNTSKKLLVE